MSIAPAILSLSQGIALPSTLCPSAQHVNSASPIGWLR
eukprot:CAMPEP_0115730616 /NCGR_PEP_ID=MMETSP0272-20121206/84132_1 /TAXON_ID=71861 /ORGANISM="Scrippsiella trochoidea, Strain CCMP3099" /LENGTH=37 /DNA_ID= /DNA_START= /DNA_END= /DNA_ORIENTATION=